MTEVIMTKVSTHKKSKDGSKDARGNILGRTTEGHGMYTFAYGKGSKRVSVTKHCSEAEAQYFKEQLSKGA